MATPACDEQRCWTTDGKEGAQMTGLRRVFAWLIVSLLVVMLIATLLLDEAS
jgi:hypothetical protein